MTLIEPQPAYLFRSWPFDVLIDREGGPTWEHALIEAKQLCGSCDDKIRARCHAENADEDWCKAVRDRRRKKAAA